MKTKKITTRKLAISALLIAIDVLMTRVFAINTPIMRVGLGFAAIVVCGIMYGPGWTALISALGDIVGSTLFPTGAYFPGFTLTAALTGFIFGFCLHREKPTWFHAISASGLNCVLVSFLANSAMISYISGNSYKSMLAARAIQLLIMFPVQCVITGILSNANIAEKVRKFQ